MDSSVSIENTYNSQGIRTRKRYFNETQNNGYIVDYTLDGTRIISVQSTNLNPVANIYTFYFIYDESGGVIGFTHGNEYYSYQKNFQGDVLGIVDKNGNVVVKYTYDAWGKLLSTTGSLASTIGVYNPFRYRSYCYDTETGLYYLNSRYYDPEIGRFLSPDSIVGDARTIDGYSAYTYCSNNPVMRYDAGGRFFDTFFDIASLGASVVDVCINPTDPLAWAGLAGDAIDLFPIVTGVGETIRVANIASDVVDTVDDVIDTVDTVDTVIDTVDIVHDIGKNAHNIGELSEDAIVSAKKIHGNSLNSTAKNYGYVLKDNDTDEVLKYGESIRGKSRYTRKYYIENNCYMEILVDGTKRDVHNWQHQRIIEHVAIYGKKPRLNKSLW